VALERWRPRSAAGGANVRGVSASPRALRDELEGLIVRAHLEHELLLARAGDELRASLPVDATGVTQAIDVLAAALGIEPELRAERDRRNRANPAVLHGRVFGRAALPAETVLAAFADGARVRAALLERLAVAIGGAPLRDQVRALLDAHPLPEGEGEGDAAGRTARLRTAYDAQERAVLLCAARLDAGGR
jgi:hypothetical protein